MPFFLPLRLISPSVPLNTHRISSFSFFSLLQRSSCTDSGDDYVCSCLPGFSGAAGRDGSGCQFAASIVTSNEGDVTVEVSHQRTQIPAPKLFSYRLTPTTTIFTHSQVDPAKAIVFKRGDVSQEIFSGFGVLSSVSQQTDSLSSSVDA